MVLKIYPFHPIQAERFLTAVYALKNLTQPYLKISAFYAFNDSISSTTDVNMVICNIVIYILNRGWNLLAIITARNFSY